MSPKRRRPKSRVRPQLTKQPDISPKSAEDYNAKCPVWRFSVLDLDGPFGWRLFDSSMRAVLDERAVAFESMTWQEILQTEENHRIPIPRLSPVAQKRLSEIEQDDIEEVMSLCVRGRIRVVGIRDRHEMKVLWWDPEHRVCPSSLKHT